MTYILLYSISWLVYYFAAYYLMFYTALFGHEFQINGDVINNQLKLSEEYACQIRNMLLAVIFNFLFFTILIALFRLRDKIYWLEFKRQVM